ncbi:hypothetical protein BGW36DRAFT_308767 [Talaromyces proteolyticus]|uniref:SIS domain-containing protein n=1 Tax=Talaromyces proteolyticus TaxID=1131652 RepID=A0AAD4PUM4_9EURO|nr:uncharacterized protein BGW36DRAFT_308767 [Talaromyces proteolyticus]KAH8689535.1 hypothetical protein BGW36DRAFT_308767 [Talaromyces proteolyticus]
MVCFHDHSPTEQTAQDAVDAITTALHVIATERDALTNLESIYRNDPLAQKSIQRAVAELVQTIKRGGKLVICGVGKSGKIGHKLEATMNSVGIHSVFLHPTEALHGDLGMIRPIDTLLLISFSGRTAELLLMLPHIPRTVPVIAITSHTHPSSCPLLSYNTSDMGILLPAPLHIDEETSFGLSAPTSSTTVALALGDALALAAARNLHTLPGQGPAEVFKGFHPGGAIGAATAASSAISTPKSSLSSSSSSSSPSCPCTSATSPSLSSLDGPTKLTLDEPAPKEIAPITISDFLVPLDTIPIAQASSAPQIRILDVLLTAIQNPAAKSWVRLSSTEIIPPYRVRSITTANHTSTSSIINVDTPLSALPEQVAVSDEHWLPVRASSTIDDVRVWVEEAIAKSALVSPLPVVISVVDDIEEDKVLGFVAADDIVPF